MLEVALFAAPKTEPGFGRSLSACRKNLRRRAAAAAPRARITWVSSGHLHITVRFIGEVDESTARAVAAALEPPLPARPFDVTVYGVGSFPERGGPRVIWAGIAVGAEPLAGVELGIAQRLHECGIRREERPYHPHVTLARIRDAAGLRSRTLLDGMTDLGFGASHVGAITLFQSRPSPQGHEYVALQRTRLGSDPRDGA